MTRDATTRSRWPAATLMLLGVAAATLTTAPTATATGQRPSAPAAPQFFAAFETSADFYDRFVYFVGNHCSFYEDMCRVESAPEWQEHILSWPGDHSMACEAPTTARTIDAGHHDQYFWWCAPGNDPAKGHVMTAQNTRAYSIVAFSPDQDFVDVRRVCWDINSTDMGGGKWTDVVIVPSDEYVRHPNTNPLRVEEGEGEYRLDYTTAGFNDDNAPGDFNIQDHDLLPGNQVWGFKNFRGVLSLFIGDHSYWDTNDEVVVTTDKAARFQHCLEELPDNSLSVTRQRPDGTTDSYVVPGAQIPDGRVRVIFQDDNYDPPKRDGYDSTVLTWHWDNITIDAS